MEEELLARIVREHDYVMTQDEASYVWAELHREMEGNRRLQVLSLLNDRLSGELTEGKRCAVCGRYDNPDCIDEC